MNQQRQRVLDGLRELAAIQSELGRRYARSRQMHPTDAAAIVEIITAEEHGRPLTPARLAERIGLTTGATSILLNRLEDAGHIVRTRENSDRRIVTLHSTPDIRADADDYYEPLAHRLDAALHDHSPAELALIEATVDRLRSTINAYLEDPR
ncbi:transcriptional regulator [Paractinoplanes abujensis]|uniref:DNA-binding MarR family transcriptional regulator n=1 Tax=Paractinoplanes abujensis TaxID=882441 RepID=A0A7W7FYV9_9ACTN|nr:MarR family transcriptional regulator [Actinoplanes abujensis]MBB4689887.1 DNA-binding MarR family transcriptional regulator [Actinoplanes abujensis]GID24709.1 transcriptional regulator [Actinoplanes abujensis]